MQFSHITMTIRQRHVVGFHGTTVDDAKSMIDGPLKDSPAIARWLGRGIYFFEENVELAMKWGEIRAARLKQPAAVVRAEIDISSCLDLTRATYQSIARNAHTFLRSQWNNDQNLRAIEQKPFELFGGQVRAGHKGDWQNYGRNQLDFQVVEKAIELAEQQRNLKLTTVRGAFIEDGPLYQNSWFYEGAHVAIAVRPDFSAIKNLQSMQID